MHLLFAFRKDTLPDWPEGVDSSSTSASCVGSNPTGVMQAFALATIGWGMTTRSRFCPALDMFGMLLAHRSSGDHAGTCRGKLARRTC